MTKCYYECDGRRHVLSAQGHATGEPQVCAAISGLLYALVGWIVNAEANPADHWVERHFEKMDPGNVLLEVSGDDSLGTAFEVTLIGLLLLANQYPEQVQVTVREEK